MQDLKIVDKPAPVIKPVDTLITQSHQRTPLPSPFPLTRNFSPMVALAVKKKYHHQSQCRVCDGLDECYFMHKSYPTS